MAVICYHALFSKLENTQKEKNEAQGSCLLSPGNYTPGQIDSLREKREFFLPWEQQNQLFFVWEGG